MFEDSVSRMVLKDKENNLSEDQSESDIIIDENSLHFPLSARVAALPKVPEIN